MKSNPYTLLSRTDFANDETVHLGNNVRIGKGVHIDPKVYIGDNCLIGHNVVIRTGCIIGVGVVIGHNTTVEENVFIGHSTRIQANCYITKKTNIGNSVFIGPCVCTTNDKNILSHGRHPDSESMLRAPTIGACARIGAQALLLPGVVVGENAFVGAGSIVTKDVPPETTWYGDGTAAIQQGPVNEAELIKS